jgi:hypothetical protein
MEGPVEFSRQSPALRGSVCKKVPGNSRERPLVDGSRKRKGILG